MGFVVEGLKQSGWGKYDVRHIGEYQTLEAAIAAARALIDAFLAREHRPGMQAGVLYSRFWTTGETPYIFRDDTDAPLITNDFNHIQYALARCAAICVQERGESAAADRKIPDA